MTKQQESLCVNERQTRWAERRAVMTESIQNRWTRESPPAPAASEETDTPLDFEYSVF